MRLITLLNHCEHFSGFVYEKARLCQHSRTIEIEMRPRRGSKPVCSGCHERGTAYDQLGLRRFEFVPVWGFIVLLLYRMRRVDCRACGVRVEEVPWATGKHQLTKAYMLFLAHWARKLSWQETAASFRSSWDKVRQAVEYVVEWGLAHRSLGPILAIGVDEIQYGKGHKYLTLVYQIEQECTRLLWVGKERTVESFEQFFTLIGAPLSEKIEYVCSDMWKPYLRVIRERCSNAVHILDRFHIVAKMNKAFDEVRAGEARRLAQDGYEPVLSATWAGKFLDDWCQQVMRSRIQPMKKIAMTMRSHRELFLNYFRTKRRLSSGVVEGLNNKAKLTMRKSYGFRTLRITEIALYHALGKLPEPKVAHRFF